MSNELTAAQPAQAAPNPLHQSIAEHVRASSRSTGQLTRLEILDDDGRPYSMLAALDVLGDMAAVSGYGDLKHVLLPSGDIYLYSRRYITDAYATLLVHVLIGDHLNLIASTVRSESETYPRPTPAHTFLGAPFHLAQEEMQAALQAMAASPDYADIHVMTASTRAVYMYSSRFLTEQYARSLMEWEEVGKYKSL